MAFGEKGEQDRGLFGSAIHEVDEFVPGAEPQACGILLLQVQAGHDARRSSAGEQLMKCRLAAP
ncbi:hypothetical protein AB0M44_01290 [Streptosporangium subroseum]|uniref:hypothetical protein n=1 Tax=Streptosporangium subroseum TaxID=106412 RepID=UPI0034131D9E